MCYESLLGLKDCASEVPSTGLYIDSLGIDKTLLGQLITGQYNNSVELFTDKRAFAWRKLSSDMLTRLSPMMKADTVIEGKRIGQLLTDASNVDAALGAGKYGGIRVKIDPNTKSFVEFYLSELSIAITGTNINVLVFDMQTLKKIDTLTYATGSLDQFFGKIYKAKRRKLDLAFVYESTVDTSKMIVKKGSCTDCGGGLRYVSTCSYVQTQGIELTTDGTTVLTSTLKKYTQGMSLNYNINCDRDSWLCSIGGLMAMPLAYATAVEIYDYALMTSPNQRVNTTVSINKDSLKEARDICASRYNDELKAMLEGMRLPDDPKCFSCRVNQVYVTALP